MNYNKTPIYVNAPINDKNDDFIDVSVYCRKITDAINNGAKMLAITSSFGTGKSSIVNLLKSKEYNFTRVIAKVSLWPKLVSQFRIEKEEENNNDDLHSFLICQMAKSMHLENADYIEEKLNKNNGIIRINTENFKHRTCLIIAFVIFLFSIFMNYYQHKTIVGINANLVRTMSTLLSIGLFAYVAFNTDVIFSSQKSEGKREYKPHQILDIYSRYILNNKDDNHKYLIVIEDLDRSDDKKLITSFLKEIRKYYVETGTNKMVFLINIKPESEIKENEDDDIDYLKLFDYIIDLPKISIDNYDSILDNLLKSQKTQINNLFPERNVSFADFPELEWIILGENISIRKIKDRLNKTFTLYENLQKRFLNVENHPLNLRKCAAAVYLKSEYEEISLNISDSFFDKLLDIKSLGKEINETELTKEKILQNNKKTEKYIKDVKKILEKGLIDYDYREYYSNYPKDSKIYKTYEKSIINAILNDKVEKSIDNDIELCKKNNSLIFKETFKRNERLGISVSESVMMNEKLLNEALIFYPHGVIDYVDNISYGDDDKDKIVNILLKIVKNYSYCVNNGVDSYIENYFVDTWIKECSKEVIKRLREGICSIEGIDIRRYGKLFENPYDCMSYNEIFTINLEDSLHFSIMRKNNYSNDFISNILLKAQDSIDAINEEILFKIKELIDNVKIENKSFITSQNYLDYMNISNALYPEYEKEIIDDCKKEDSLYDFYVELVNRLDKDKITEHTLDTISQIDKQKGYNRKIANRLYEDGYYYDSLLVCLENDYNYDINDINIKESLSNDNIENLNNKHVKLLSKLRSRIINESVECLDNYMMLFNESVQIVDSKQMKQIFDIVSISKALEYINLKQINNEFADELISVLNSKGPSNEDVYNVLSMYKKWPQSIVKEFFEKLDMHEKYNMYKLKEQERTNIKNNFKIVYVLTTSKELLEFSNKTWYLDSTFDNLYYATINDANYAELVDKVNINSITNTTISNIEKIMNKGYYSEKFENVLYQKESFRNYALSKIMRTNEFIMEEEKLENLWPAYIELFKTIPDSKIGLMTNNNDFLQEIIYRNSYDGIPDIRLKSLAKVKQNINILEYINMNKSENFITEYLSQIRSIDNDDVSNKIVEIITSKNDLLLNNKIHENIYNKLTTYKSKHNYTAKRNLLNKGNIIVS